MSDGGVEESKREGESESFDLLSRRRARASPDDYGRTTAKIAVTQVCEGVGFDCVKQSALEALANVAVRYICHLGKSATFNASLAGRSECNVFDIVKGLEDLGFSSGCSSSSEGKQYVVGSGVVKEIVDFVGTVEDTPFARPIPRFPVVKRPSLIPSFSETGESPSSKHIPDWLPAFPDPHTYMQTPVWNEKKVDIKTDKAEQVRQRRKAEKSLLNLQQRLLSNGLAGPSGSGHGPVENGVDTGAAMVDNPFLAPALPAGTVDVSPVALPPRFGNHCDGKLESVRQTFAPVIEALDGAESDHMELDERVLSNRKPVVRFKLKAGKKMLAEDLDVHLRSKANEKRSSLFGRDDEKDDKKRRAELILRQSMENAQEQS